MIDVIRWLILLEVLSVAALPLATWVFRFLPDRGYALAKLLALLLITWITWWLGSFIPIGGNLYLLWSLVAVSGLAGWAIFGRQTIAALRRIAGVIVMEESLFVAAFIAWAFVRSLHPDIGGMYPTTEQPMDLMYLQASAHAVSYPPQDLWLAGHGVNYYYFGYLLMSITGRMAGSSMLVTYNLALALIFASAVALTYSLAYNITQRRVWSLLGPLFVVLLGNEHSLFFQVLNGHLPWNSPLWYWESTRVVGETSPGQATTINEFPLFSLILGDLHPHVMAVPLTLLSLAFSLALFLEVGHTDWGERGFAWPRTPWRAVRPAAHPVRLALGAIAVGSLFATNTWDFPTYLLLAVAALFLGISVFQHDSRRAEAQTSPELHRGASRWSSAAWTALLFTGLALAASVPFWVRYESPTHGIGLVTTPTNLGQFAQVFGFSGFLAICFVGWYAWRQGILRVTAGSLRRTSPEMGSSARQPSTTLILPVAVLILAGIVAILHLWVLLLAVVILGACTWLLCRPQTDRPARAERFILLLIAVAGLLVATTEVVYLRDVFDGTPFYRMNTVFKFYYQIWILLGLASACAAALLARRLRTRNPIAFTCLIASIVIGTAIGGVYTVLGPISFYGALDGGPVRFQLHPLDGLARLEALDPEDYQAIQWIRGHVQGNPIVLEATGGEYTTFARVSIYTGLPTLLGWSGHEQQWRGNDPLLGLRHGLIDHIYSTGSAALASGLIARNHVSIVYVGPCERQIYASGPTVCGPSTAVASAPNALTKFGSFMRTIYRQDGVTIYETAESGR